MAVSESGPKSRARRDRERAAYLQALGDERTTGRCAQCYRIVTIESRKSRYTHICRG